MRLAKILHTFLKSKKTSEKISDYSSWIKTVESKNKDISETGEIKKNIRISIILVVMDGDENRIVNSTIESVILQTNPNWELIVFGKNIKEKIIKENIIYIESETKTFFSLINEASKSCNGNYITCIQSGDLLASRAIQLILSKYKAKIIYSDEDSLNEKGERVEPVFKPDWNPDYLTNYNYLSKAVIYDLTLFRSLKGFDVNNVNPYHALSLNVTNHVSQSDIAHIDEVLFHFKDSYQNSPIKNKAILENNNPLVSIIIPTKNHVELLEVCITDLLTKTSYKNFEIIIIDNQSKEPDTLVYLKSLSAVENIKIIKYEKPFNYSEMNNLAVTKANGSILCFLNNDISIIKNDWLTEMVSQASREEIGCVGAKLFYPDGTIQHAGVILGLKGYASHSHKGFAGDSEGYCNRLNVAHNVSAVTAACLVMRKTVFEEIGGFDAVNLKVAYNDVDLCLKVGEVGYRNLFTPHAQLIHHESKSRGKKRNKEQQKQLQEESAFLLEKWGGVLFSDPAYNKNLTLLKEDFSLGFDRIHK